MVSRRRMSRESLPPQDQHRPFRVVQKLRDPNCLTADQAFGYRRWIVAAPKPDHLRRRPEGSGELVEIGICRSDCKAIGLCELPHYRIRRLKKPLGANVLGIREQVRNTPDEPAREILIQQQFHSATRRPTRAA